MRSPARDHHRARVTLLQTGTLSAWRHLGRPLAPRTAQANEQANLELGNKAAALLGVPLLAPSLRLLSTWHTTLGIANHKGPGNVPWRRSAQRRQAEADICYGWHAYVHMHMSVHV